MRKLLQAASSSPSITASSQKKRKLAPFASNPVSYLADAPPSPPAATPSSASSSPLRSSFPSNGHSPSSDPPNLDSILHPAPTAHATATRIFPPHVHEEVLLSREQSSQSQLHGGSSPTRAFAEFSIGYTSSVDMSESEHGANGNDHRSAIGSSGTIGVRSASPAKRPAADMDESVDRLSTRANATADDQHMSGTTPDPPSDMGDVGDGGDLPSIDSQVQEVKSLIDRPLEVGMRGFAVSYQWMERVLARTTVETAKGAKYPKEAREGPIGPVDNSSIVPDDAFPEFPLYDSHGEPFVPLSLGASMDEHFQVIPEKAWKLIMKWYGLKKGQRPIIRYAQDTAEPPSTNIIFELHPPIFTIRICPRPNAHAEPMPSTAVPAYHALRLKDEQRRRGQLSPDDAIQFVSSRKEKFQRFLLRSKEAAAIPRSSKVRIWKLLSTASVIGAEETKPREERESRITEANGTDEGPHENNGVDVSATTTPSDTKLLVLSEEFHKLLPDIDLEQIDAPDETNNDNYNGSSTMDRFQLFEDATLILEEISTRADPNVDKKARKILNIKGPRPPSVVSSGRTSPAPGSIITRGRARRDGRTRGTVGLTNLGNTCYMNSALQCIRSIEELSFYFLTEKYKTEINASNPLGHGGIMAKQYAGVLNGIYGDSTGGAFSPSNFKRTLGSVQPLFSGYGQQDSQEFLSFLVDALHEDLNRIQKKPYNENPDSDDKTVHDPQAIIALGETYRKNHKARNDSVAMDLFSGFYKNTMECPVCDKISITFDPFSLVTLQLPIENTFRHTIIFVPWRSRPINQRIDIDKNATMKMVKQQVASKHDRVNPDHLWIAEVYSNRVYKVYDDQCTIAEANIQANDRIFIFELAAAPTNMPAPSKSRFSSYSSYGPQRIAPADVDMDSSKADQFAIPIFSRKRSRNGDNWDLILHPLYICISRNEAQDFDAILNHILDAVASITSRPILSECNTDVSKDSGVDSRDDVASNDAARVSDSSVPSEDGYVEVSVDHAPTSHDPNTEATKHNGNIREYCRHLFQVFYSQSQEGSHHTGLSQPSHHKMAIMESRVKVADDVADATPAGDSDGANSRGSSPSHDDLEGNDDQEEAESDADESQMDQDPPSDPQDTPVDTEGQEVGLSQDPKGNEVEAQARPVQRSKGKPNKFGAKRKNKDKIRTKKERKAQNRISPPIHVPRAVDERPAESSENPYFIRLGEGIFLDWTPEGYDALFGSKDTNDNDMRGRFTSDPEGKGLPELEDATLDAVQARRNARKEHGITLDDCFIETGKREILSEDNAWYCNRCKEMRQAAKTLEIWTMPEILIVHLKRFGGNRSFRDKIDVKVEYPVEGLDMTDRIGAKEDGKEYIYDLFAVDNHFGGLGGGHYTAMAKNFYDGQWYDYNDSSCTKVGEKRLQSAAAYLLFYRRRSDKPLGPAYLQELVTSARNPPTPESGDENGEEGESESGEGQLGALGSSLHGSPSDLVRVAAGAESLRKHGHGVGVGAGLRPMLKTAAGMEMTRDDSDASDTNERPPDPWRELEEEDFYRFGGSPKSPMMGPLGPSEPTWSFDNADERMSITADMDSTRGSMDGSNSDGMRSPAFAHGHDSDDAMQVEQSTEQDSPPPADIHLADELLD